MVVCFVEDIGRDVVSLEEDSCVDVSCCVVVCLVEDNGNEVVCLEEDSCVDESG